MKTHSIDIALENLNKLISDYSTYKTKDMSESDTRSKVIDFIFKDVLGWNEIDITREEKVDTGYYDYLVSTSDFSFIVEAKRDFKKLELPIKGTSFNIATIEKGNAEVVKQIREYISDKSLASGVITNGNQFIVGTFVNTSGADWRKNKVIIFRSLEEIRDNFIRFYNLLSKETVLEKRSITSEKESVQPQILFEHMRGHNDSLVRNDFSAQLSKVIQTAFSELSSEDTKYEKELLDFCYVKNDDIKKYNSDLEIVFSDDPPKFDDKILPVKNTESIHEQLKDKIQDKTNLKEQSPLMIIIGGKGVGKTTFIKNFFYSIGNKENLSRPSIYLDFRKYTEQDVKNTDGVCKRIIDQIKEQYPALNIHTYGVLQQVYSKELKENKESVWKYLLKDEDGLEKKTSEFFTEKMNNNPMHLEAISKYLINHCGKKLCLIFDNADQLDDSSQKAAFILAESLHRRLNAIVIISLREGYYYRWKNKPPFDAFLSTVFHISAPPYKEVLKKRLEYVIKNVSFKEITTTIRNKTITLSADGFKNLFSNLQDTLFGYTGSPLLEFLEETSYPNIRSGIDKVSKFLISGHSKLDVYMTTNNYRIPIWEFVKSIALESRFYYRHEESLLFNIFYPAQNSTNHFLKIRLLHFLLKQCDGKVHTNKYVNVKEILDVFRKGAYVDDVVLEELTTLLKYNLIDSIIVSSDIDSDETVSLLSSVKITYPGSYYLRRLLREFYYLELVLQDTPIYNEDAFSKIKDSFPESGPTGKSDLSKRYETVTHFLNYLELEIQKEKHRSTQGELDDSLVIDVFKEYIHNDYLKRGLELVKGKFSQSSLPLS